MKILLKITLIFFCTAVFAQKTIERTVGEFTDLKVYDLIVVELVKADVDKVVIKGLNTDNVLVNNKNGTLKIKMNLKETFDGKKTKITLYYTVVDVIDVNEGARVFAKEEIKQFELDLKAQEGGKIDVPVKNTYTNVKTVTGGQISLSGTTKKQKVNISTGGVYKGEKLVSETTEVKVSAGGNANINATKLVEVSTAAGGNVYIYGTPEKVEQTSVLGGNVEFVED